MIVNNSVGPSRVINSMWGDMPLPSKNKLQKFVGDLLLRVTKLYNVWVMRGYVSKEEYFSEMYSQQLEEAIKNANRYKIAKRVFLQFAAKADEGDHIGVAMRGSA